jgi:hypothetical protein
MLRIVQDLIAVLAQAGLSAKGAQGMVRLIQPLAPCSDRRILGISGGAGGIGGGRVGASRRQCRALLHRTASCTGRAQPWSNSDIFAPQFAGQIFS